MIGTSQAFNQARPTQVVIASKPIGCITATVCFSLTPRPSRAVAQRSAVTTRFRADVKSGKEGVEIWFNKRRLYTFGGSDALQRADESAARLNRFFDEEPNLFDVAFDGKEILGRRSPLIDVRAEDVQAEKKSTEDVGRPGENQWRLKSVSPARF